MLSCNKQEGFKDVRGGQAVSGPAGRSQDVSAEQQNALAAHLCWHFLHSYTRCDSRTFTTPVRRTVPLTVTRRWLWCVRSWLICG